MEKTFENLQNYNCCHDPSIDFRFRKLNRQNQVLSTLSHILAIGNHIREIRRGKINIPKTILNYLQHPPRMSKFQGNGKYRQKR